MHRSLAGIVLASLILTILGGCKMDQSSETVPVAAEPVPVVLQLAGEYPLRNDAVSVDVSDTVVNTVVQGLFGANLSHRGNGYNIYNPETDSFHEAIMAQLKASGVSHLRYPGGIQGDYIHWNESVGENRIPQIDPFSASFPVNADKDGESYVIEFGPDEFARLCAEAGVQATVHLNAGNGSAEQAADWVRYYKEKGVDVASFCVGNEVCMAEERVEGMTVTKTPVEYVEFYKEVWKALDGAADGIEFGAIGITPSHPLNKYRQWDATVIAGLADKLDFIDVHIGYTPYFVNEGTPDEDVLRCMMASSTFVKLLIEEEKNIIANNAGQYADDISIQITEWGPLGGKYSNGVAGALYAASFLNTVTVEPKVSSACYLPLINHYDAANLLGSRTDGGRDEHWDNCVTFVFRMYARQTGRQVLSANVTGCKTFDSKRVGLVPGLSDIPDGEATVYFDPATGEGSIFLLNKSLEDAVSFQVQLPFQKVRLHSVEEIWDENPAVRNSYLDKQQFAPVVTQLDQQLTDGKLTVQSKPLSLLKIDFTVSDSENARREAA